MIYLHTKYHKARQKGKKGSDTSKLRNNASTHYTEFCLVTSIAIQHMKPQNKHHIATVIVKDRKIRNFIVG
jgi:hypothetical protein